MNSKTEFLTLGADIGGKDAFNAINQHVLVLRGLIRQDCLQSFDTSLLEIALVLRVDGSVQAWGKRGVENVSFQKRKAFATADIFVPRDVWSIDDVYSLRQFLIEQVVSATQLVIEAVNEQGVIFDGKSLEVSLGKVGRQFMT